LDLNTSSSQSRGCTASGTDLVHKPTRTESRALICAASPTPTVLPTNQTQPAALGPETAAAAASQHRPESTRRRPAWPSTTSPLPRPPPPAPAPATATGGPRPPSAPTAALPRYTCYPDPPHRPVAVLVSIPRLGFRSPARAMGG
jgi:hypothetical protein